MSDDDVELLRRAPLELIGRIVDSSNATFLVRVCASGDSEPSVGGDDDETSASESLSSGLKAVYKPLRGERPLWDFPEGLYRREAAAYELSVDLGWDLVPPTVVREDAPLGIGSVQRFIDADFAEHYFTMRESSQFHDQLIRMCVFDLLVNNTDRKGGHVLVDGDGHLWGIDNALCFSTEARLRTVIWDWSGEPVPADLMEAVNGLIERGLPASVTDLLIDNEADAVIHRAKVLRSAGQLPHDPTGRRIPWPLI